MTTTLITRAEAWLADGDHDGDDLYRPERHDEAATIIRDLTAEVRDLRDANDDYAALCETPAFIGTAREFEAWIDGTGPERLALAGSRAEILRLRAEVARLTADDDAARGELRVDIDEAQPGSTVRRLLLANVAMRREWLRREPKEGER